MSRVATTSRHGVIEQGAETNNLGGIFTPGKAYDFSKKVEVALAYKSAKDTLGGLRPNIRQIMRDCQVSVYFVKKIERELETHGRVLQLKEVAKERKKTKTGPVGPGAKSLGEAGAFVLYQLLSEEPSRSLSSYVLGLYVIMGVVISKATIDRVLRESFPKKCGLYQPNLVPYDKFRPSNIEKALDYLTFVAMVAPDRLKFGDEKLLKEQELYNRKVRCDPFTGKIPPMTTAPDFRNTHSLTGFCGIDTRPPALFFTIHESNNDATQFAMDFEAAIDSGFFHPGDILVLDNAVSRMYCYCYLQIVMQKMSLLSMIFSLLSFVDSRNITPGKITRYL